MSGRYRPKSGKQVTHPRRTERQNMALFRRKQDVVNYTALAVDGAVDLICPELAKCTCRHGSLDIAQQDVANLERKLGVGLNL